MGEVGLLVKLRLVQTEAVGDVEHGLRLVLESLLAILGRGVAADVEGLAADVDLLAVGLVDSTVNLFKVVGI